MKKILYILAILSMLFLLGCEQKPNVDTMKTENGRVYYKLNNAYDIEEVEIKGHLYLITHVRGGYSITHAGHCPATHN